VEARLTTRLEQHEGALSGVQQAISELPQVEARLTTRLEQHEGALSGVQQAISELPQVEARLTTRLEQQSVVVESLQHANDEHRAALESVSKSMSTVQEQMLSLETKLAAAHESAQHAEQAAHEIGQSAELQATLFGEIHAVGVTVKSHAAAIESIRASMARTDDFMERVVEALESLQTMVLEQARDHAVA
jgi:chromosome segregation ATPase